VSKRGARVIEDIAVEQLPESSRFDGDDGRVDSQRERFLVVEVGRLVAGGMQCAPKVRDLEHHRGVDHVIDVPHLDLDVRGPVPLPLAEQWGGGTYQHCESTGPRGGGHAHLDLRRCVQPGDDLPGRPRHTAPPRVFTGCKGCGIIGAPTRPSSVSVLDSQEAVVVTLGALWQPIVLSAVLVFIVSSLVHMVLKYHASDYTQLPNEDAVRAAIRAGNPAPAQYIIPYCKEMKDLESPEMKQKFTEGPVAVLNLKRPGVSSMGPMLL